MAFTVADALMRAASYTDEDIEETDALLWANDFLREKVDTRLWPEGAQAYAAIADMWYNLPAAFVLVLKVTDSAGVAYGNYVFRSGKISFAESDTYTLTYRATPTALTAQTGAGGTPALPDYYLGPLAYFITSRFRAKDDPEDPDALKWMAECDNALRKLMGGARASNKPLRRRWRW